MFSPIQDLVQAARALLRARAFTAVCVISLGLGMSVVIGIFMFTRFVIGTPPGIDDGRLAELVIRPVGQLRAQAGTGILDTWSYPDYLDVRESARGMAITGWSMGEALFKAPGQAAAVPVPTMYVSSNYFSTIGVTLPLGPGFTPADDASRAEPEAVIGHRVWQMRFGSDPAIIGRTITIDQTDHVVVGVAPERFRGHTSGLNDSYRQLWLPLSRHPRLLARGADGGRPGGAAAESVRFARDAAVVRVVARLPDEMTVEQADAIVQSAAAALAARHPDTNRDKTGGVEPYFGPGARLRSQISFGLFMVYGMAGVVLLVVGLNLSGMMLVRSAMRERELAIRLAMGASRWRLMRYHLSEALALAILGGCFAAALLFGAPAALAWTFSFSGPVMELFAPDLWLVAQCIALCFVTALVLGLLPAIRFSRPGIVAALKNDASGRGRRVGRLQRFTAAAQAGIAVPFLVLCGVQFDLARTTAFADVGFMPRGLYAARVNLAAITSTEDERSRFIQAAGESLAQASGVTAVSVGDGLPLDFIYRNARVARVDDGVESNFATAHTTRIGAGYVEAVGIRLLTGRTIERTDRLGTELVVLLSEPLAGQLFPDGDPLGRRVSFALGGNEPRTYTVVGVTADLVSTQMGNPRPQLFVALEQHPGTNLFVIARGTQGDPAMRGTFESATAAGLRAAGVPQGPDTEPGLLLGEFTTGEGLIDNSRYDLLTHSGVSGLAAAVALVLAALGVYGVIAFLVATRTREIGVRIALGASRGRVLRDVLGDALKLVVPGIGVGLLLAVLWVRLADPAWYPLGGVEPLVYTLAAAVSLMVAALAGVPSARRAARVQPMIAMRAE